MGLVELGEAGPFCEAGPFREAALSAKRVLSAKRPSLREPGPFRKRPSFRAANPGTTQQRWRECAVERHRRRATGRRRSQASSMTAPTRTPSPVATLMPPPAQASKLHTDASWSSHPVMIDAPSSTVALRCHSRSSTLAFLTLAFLDTFDHRLLTASALS